MLFNKDGFQVFYDADSTHTNIPLYIQALYVERQKYIDELRQKPLGNTDLIKRLKEQQNHLIDLARQNRQDFLINRIIKDYEQRKSCPDLI